jgi:hypothetical protein
MVCFLGDVDNTKTKFGIGYHSGNLLWRGRFSGTAATGVFLAVVGGTSRYLTFPSFFNPHSNQLVATPPT